MSKVGGVVFLAFFFVFNGTLWAEEAPEKPQAQKIEVLQAAARVEAAKPATPAPEPKSADRVQKPNLEKDYILQTGDHIKITIYPEDDLIKGATMEISSEGNITLPLVGKVAVAGKPSTEAEHAIAEILDRDYIVNPEVVIEVVEKYGAEKEKTVVLLGQVKNPGSHPFPKTEHFTLLQAIAIAGGFSDIANIKKIKIIRGGAEKGEVLRANAEDIISGNKPDIDLEDGDIINVAESLF